jgi:hypothetical protein
MKQALIVMRLADMRKVHPNQDDSFVCARCQAPVGIFPAGVRMIKAKPDTEVVCQICHGGDHSIFLSEPVPGMFEDLKGTVDLKGVKKH